MPHIVREDGERFIIPSYRDVLSAKKPGLLKREILLLTSNYGEYIALQKKSATQYEIAFSPEPGILLGETVWSYFKKPRDLVYCEEIPNTNEAILVIVKGGSVYLDGLYPIESIPDELVVFLTQQNNFEIFIQGNVPISQTEEEGKFTFDPASVKSFTILEAPVFPTLPIVKQFQLQLVDVTLKAMGIGVFPVGKLIASLLLIGLIWVAWNYISTKEQLPVSIVSVVNPYQIYLNQLTSPDPATEIQKLAENMMLFYTIPGWNIVNYSYSGGQLTCSIKSAGARTNSLFTWAEHNKANVEVMPDGFYVSRKLTFINRPQPTTIYELKYIIASLIDRLSYILPGNNLTVGNSVNKGKYTEIQLTIKFDNITPTTLTLLGEQLKRYPFVLSNVSGTVNDTTISGTIVLTALGS